MRLNYILWKSPFIPALTSLILFLALSAGSVAGASGDRTENLINSETAADSLEWYHGTVKLALKDNTHITPFGISVFLQKGKDEGTARHRASTNNAGRYYFKKVVPGRYLREIYYDGINIYTDSLVIGGTAGLHLETVIIPVGQLEQNVQKKRMRN